MKVRDIIEKKFPFDLEEDLVETISKEFLYEWQTQENLLAFLPDRPHDYPLNRIAVHDLFPDTFALCFFAERWGIEYELFPHRTAWVCKETEL